MPLGLRGKLAAAFLSILLPVLGVLIYDYLDNYGRLLDTLANGQARTTQTLGTFLEATLDQGVAVGQAIALDPEVRNLSSGNPSRLDAHLAAYLSAFPRFLDINVWDAAGNNAGASSPPPPGQPRPSIADREHFREAVSTGKPAISGVIISRIGGHPTAAVAAPIRDLQGRIIGVVTLLVNFDAVVDSLRSISLGPDRAAWATDRSGRAAFLSTNPALSWEARDLSWYKPVQAALSQGRFIGPVDSSPLGGPRLDTCMATPTYGWIVGISLAQTAYQTAASQTLASRMGIYMGILLLAGLIALWSIHAITRPLGALAQTMAAFGRGELDSRAEVKTGDELETTAETFNRMAASLQREQERLRFLLETGTSLASAMDVGMVVRLLAERTTQMLGDCTWVCLMQGNQGCAEISIYTRDPSLHPRLMELFDQHGPWVAANLFTPVVRSGEPLLIPDLPSLQGMEPALRDGLQGLGRVSAMVIPLHARGRPVGVLASLSLAQERRLGEEELALGMDLAGRAGLLIDNAILFRQVEAQQRRLQTVLDTVPVGVLAVEDGDGRISLVNRMGEGIMGRSPLGVPLERWAAEVGLRRAGGEPYPAREDPLSRTVLAGEAVVAEEMMLGHPSGRTVYLLGHTAPLRDAEGRAVGAVAAMQDITPLKETQRRLEEASQRLREANRDLAVAAARQRELAREHERRRSELDAVLEGISEGVTITDGSGSLLRINEAGRTILGVRPEWVGRRLVDYEELIRFHRPDDREIPPDEWPLRKALRGETIQGEEMVVVRPDGTRANILVSTSVVRGEDGAVRLAMSIYRDISPIRELERTREEFISVVAHDLRSPLTVITGFIGLLQRLPPEQHGSPQEQRALASILNAAKRLDRMVGDLLDASRIEASRLSLTKERVDLPALVREVVERSFEITKGHPLKVEVRGDIPEVEADPARLEQVLTNLLSNAAKYSYPGTEILTELESRDGEVVVSVTNQGEGIKPEERESIFTRFRRTRTAEEGRVPGLGLGLYITKGLVEAHGGRIWVESEIGKSTTFRFTLPAPPPAS